MQAAGLPAPKLLIEHLATAQQQQQACGAEGAFRTPGGLEFERVWVQVGWGGEGASGRAAARPPAHPPDAAHHLACLRRRLCTTPSCAPPPRLLQPPPPTLTQQGRVGTKLGSALRLEDGTGAVDVFLTATVAALDPTVAPGCYALVIGKLVVPPGCSSARQIKAHKARVVAVVVWVQHPRPACAGVSSTHVARSGAGCSTHVRGLCTLAAPRPPPHPAPPPTCQPSPRPLAHPPTPPSGPSQVVNLSTDAEQVAQRMTQWNSEVVELQRTIYLHQQQGQQQQQQ